MFLTLADFQGRWRLSREIFDDAHRAHRAHRAPGQFAGEAVFQPEAGGLRYVETGTLMLAGQPPMTATQRYLWQPGADAIDVFFPDGRAFHRIDLTLTQPEAHHHCAPDDYRVRYDFSQWPNWFSHWHVTGPRKAYELRNSFVHL